MNKHLSDTHLNMITFAEVLSILHIYISTGSLWINVDQCVDLNKYQILETLSNDDIMFYSLFIVVLICLLSFNRKTNSLFQDTFTCKMKRGAMEILANTAAWWLFTKTTPGWNNMTDTVNCHNEL